MRTKKIGTVILAMVMLMLVMPAVGVQAALPPPPSEEDYIEHAVAYMQLRHIELSTLNASEWSFDVELDLDWLILKIADTDADGSGLDYEFVWEGKVIALWNIFKHRWMWTVLEHYYYFEDYPDIVVNKIGPGTTNPAPGTYHVKAGNSYKFTAKTGISEDEYIRFIFIKWTIDDGSMVTEELGEVLRGTAATDLAITAIFEAKQLVRGATVYEDGLNPGIMWQNDHQLLSMDRLKGASEVSVTIINGSITLYSKTFHTQYPSFAIYFRPESVKNAYTIEVTATNADGDYDPNWHLSE
uniref:Uncharacterized protein n=1 Tax=viral metagenome TaxID=1070528 RepID=A0A6M3M3P5_9ZZZZ